jgi:hypothetical protein
MENPKLLGSLFLSGNHPRESTAEKLWFLQAAYVTSLCFEPLQAAVANFQEARAVAKEVRSQFLPTVAALGGPSQPAQVPAFPPRLPPCFTWGQHPIATPRSPGVFSDRETRTLLPNSTVSRRTIAGADYELEPDERKGPAVASRGSPEGIPHLPEPG